MDKLVKHGIKMLEIIENERGFYKDMDGDVADIARAVYDTILRVQVLERNADRKTEPRKEQNFCGKCRYLYRDFKYGLSCYRLMDNEPCKYEERKTEPQTCDDCIWSVCNYNKVFEDEPTTEDLQDWKDRMWAEAVVTEPTTEDCSMVEPKDEPQK